MAALGAPVLIVDADAPFRRAVAGVLRRRGFDVTEYSRGEDALTAAAASRPAAVVLEAALPDVDGLEVCRELRERHGDDLPLIIVSAERSTPHDRLAGLLIGADDYQVKPINPDELVVRLRRLLTRGRASPATPTEEPHNALSPRELEVLRLLADGQSAATIAEQLVISHKTVAGHIQRVMAKLGVHSRTQAVAQAYLLGLVGGPSEEPSDLPLSIVR